MACVVLQKIRTVELDGKVIKLQIVSFPVLALLYSLLHRHNPVLNHIRVLTVGYSRPGEVPDHH